MKRGAQPISKIEQLDQLVQKNTKKGTKAGFLIQHFIEISSVTDIHEPISECKEQYMQVLDGKQCQTGADTGE